MSMVGPADTRPTLGLAFTTRAAATCHEERLATTVKKNALLRADVCMMNLGMRHNEATSDAFFKDQTSDDE